MNEKKRCGIKARLSIATGIVSIVLATGIIAGCTQDVSPDEPEQRNPVIITWNGQMDVTAGGKSLSLSIARKIHLYRATQSQDSLTTRLVAPQKKRRLQ